MSSADLPGFRVRAGLNAQPFHVHHKLKAHRKMSLAARDDMYTSLLQTEIKQKLLWFGKIVMATLCLTTHLHDVEAHRKMLPVVPIGKKAAQFVIGSPINGKKIVAATHVNTGALGEKRNGVETIAAVIVNVGDVIEPLDSNIR